ncbi:MAG: hypothetical protein FWG03_05730 [Clostridiales bacterium]|nr:hypothetical protein [Clostridiales bacterium]
MKLRRYFVMINVLIGLAIAGLFCFGGARLFVSAYVTVFAILVVRNMLVRGDLRVRIGLWAVYALILSVQIIYAVEWAFPDGAGAEGGLLFWMRKLFGIVLLLVPMFISRYVTAGKYATYYLPSVSEARAISIAGFRDNYRRFRSAAGDAKGISEKLSPDNFKDIFEDLHRFDQFNYVNDGSLTDAYFEEASLALTDGRLYIVISNTGSPASEIISVFTSKQFNHASLSFDRDLKTLISYNGGDRVYPPGLNPEMLSFFNKKEGAGILVYSLLCPEDKKSFVLDKIREINEEGSAYNMLGLVSGVSFRPNIMFCSQFVYRMLELSGLAYFTKPGGKIEPTDFVELDYRRDLRFEYEILFNA